MWTLDTGAVIDIDVLYIRKFTRNRQEYHVTGRFLRAGSDLSIVMATVDPFDSMAYGFKLLGYLLGVLVLGFAIAVLGAQMVGELSSLLGQLVFVGGVAVVLAGLIGIQHKVIADSVDRGTASRSELENERERLPDGLSVLKVQRADEDEDESKAEASEA